ncbi:hypothetical protein SpCBS45565_g08491 [Spizellomyces sp. 'palustris']|nr:hypothetical protein SpCBS45565_g08491 [Spizellomyces sp. 'palustris']
MKGDRGELSVDEAIEFFRHYGIKLRLTTALNPEGNGKSEQRHQLILQALAKACDGQMKRWPDLLPLAMLADHTTVTRVTVYAPCELMNGQKPLLPVEQDVLSWRTLNWEDNMGRGDLIALCIRQLERRKEDLVIVEGDWVLVWDTTLDNQYRSERKLARRWKGPYVVLETNANGTYRLAELDGAELRALITGKRVKLFKQRIGQNLIEVIGEDELPAASDEADDQGGSDGREDIDSNDSDEDL